MSSDRVTRGSDEPRPGTEALAGDRTPNQPDPQDDDPVDDRLDDRVDDDEVDDDERADREEGDGTSEPEADGGRDDETPAERYRDSPGIGVDKTSGDVPEPNEPG
jgi:hypothetical protein